MDWMAYPSLIHAKLNSIIVNNKDEGSLDIPILKLYYTVSIKSHNKKKHNICEAEIEKS